jgi:probable F420-dependent oxidoreductase
MRYGASLPFTDWHDVTALRDYAQALEGAGMDYAMLQSHILSVREGRIPDEPWFHTLGPFREPMVLFAYLAGQTQRIVLRTAVLILPLYSTALLAKQAADVSIISGGRLELGVSVSWNKLEYEAMAQDHASRGRRLEEQVTLLRKMFTEQFVTFEGRWHKLDDIGVNQLPPPIPIFIGTGNEERLLRRAARLGDGWLPLWDPVEALPTLHRLLEEEGRDVRAFQVGYRMLAGPDGPKSWVAAARRFQSAGVTDLSIAARAESKAESLATIIKCRDVLREELG